jgi:hypothetical protein
MFSLGRDVRANVRLAFDDFGSDLLFAIPALRHVPLNLPGHLELGLRVEPHGDIEQAPQRARVQREETLHDDDVLGLDALGSDDRAIRMIVDRLIDRAALAQRPQVFFHRGEIIGARIERRQPNRAALPAIQRVIIIEADRFDPLRAEDRIESPAQRCFSGPGITADGDHDRPTKHRKPPER